METTYDSVIEQIVQSIYATMLNAELVRVEESAAPAKESLLATIQITGQWMGSVVISLSPDAARATAAAMLSISPDEATDADQQEVAAELVNMIGGNLKSLLPPPSYLSIPAVVTGDDFGQRMHGAALIDDVAFAWEGGALRVRLYAKPKE